MNRIRRFIKQLETNVWTEVIELPEWKLQKAKYICPGVYEFENNSPSVQQVGKLDGGYGTTYFMSLEIVIPPGWGPDETALLFEAGGEGLLKINGEPYHGLDRNHNYIPLPASVVGRKALLEIELYDPIPEPVDPLNNQAIVQPPVSGVRSRLARVDLALQSLFFTIKVVSESARLLPEQDLRRHRMLEALYEVMDEVYDGAGEHYASSLRIGEAEKRLKDKVHGLVPAGNINGTMHMVGQSHIDIAWLWPVRETVRKVSRTFSTMCTLMDRYPEFLYSQSQPQLYAYVKEHYPQLYDKIKSRIAEGRWELVGGMWVEPDLNIPNGESLVRQIVYGQSFYQQEFGKKSTIEWLPDTFGYCASLPQLLKLAGVDYFMTTKLGWNDTNKFPYDLFQWVGIDGTPILSYQNHGVNEHTHPKEIQDHWQSYRQKDTHDELMLLYGHGDGGGGVTHEMIEYVHRSALMPGQPKARFSKASDFFAEISRRKPELPVWHGDLYLELHRGTYTTHARNKRNNRKAEVLYREAELWERMAAIVGRKTTEHGSGEGPGSQISDSRQDTAASLQQGWKLILLNQFHDIIPGTSIPEVYETSLKEYEQIVELGDKVLQASIQNIIGCIATEGSGVPILIFNSLGWEREETITLGAGELKDLAGWDATRDAPDLTALSKLAAYDEQGRQMASDLIICSQDGSLKSAAVTLCVSVTGIPAFGWKTIWLREQAESAAPAEGAAAHSEFEETIEPREVAYRQYSVHAEPVPAADSIFPDQWETGFYVIGFNDNGEIVRWFDKVAGRELLKEGGKANELQFFHDRPTYWDAWDIDPKYERQKAGHAQLVSREVVHMGRTKDILSFRWHLNQSVIEQEMIIYHHRRRVDFQTKVDWKESHKLLKVAFPADLVAGRATYEIPFGSLERPTHRNTSWEQAQFEVCGHRWADVSEGGYGVALLNDCKYGYDINSTPGGTVMRLSLLRAPRWPDRHADQGEHVFTYSLYPHTGDWRSGSVVREAAELNHPAIIATCEIKKGQLPSAHSLLDWQSEHVILETIKPAEDGGGTVLRFYESSGGREKIRFRWPETGLRASLANLLEEELEQPEGQDQANLFNSDGEIELDFKPYEIKTVKITHQ